MHSILAAVAQLVILADTAEARYGKGGHEVQVSKNWAGVNSFFLHAFPEYVFEISAFLFVASCRRQH